MTASRARAGHARTKRAGVASRALAALAVVATAASTLVVSQVAAPQAAQAAQEPAATKIDVGEVSAWMGKGVTNNSETDTTTDYNNFIRYGIVKGMTEDRVRTGDTPTTTTLGGPYAKANDAWTYIARGAPWKWDEQTADWGDSAASKAWMQAHFEKWRDAGSKAIWVNGQSAIGFKPNNPGQVEPGQTFLLGAIRHNNLPIGGTTQIQQYLHSSLGLQLTGLIPGDTGESYPFVNYESFNTLASTIMYRKGGAYVKTDGVSGFCSPQFGRNGWDATQKINNKLPRDLVLNGEAGTSLVPPMSRIRSTRPTARRATSTSLNPVRDACTASSTSARATVTTTSTASTTTAAQSSLITS